MNWLDIVLGIVILMFVIRGILKGLFREGFGLAGILLGLILAINRYPQLGAVIHSEFTFISTKVAHVMSFAIIFGGIAISSSIAGILVHDMFYRHTLSRGIEEGGGFILGLIEGALVCSIVLILISVSPLSPRLENWSKGSTLVPYLLRVGPFVYDNITSLTPGEAKKFMEKLDPSELQHLSVG